MKAPLPEHEAERLAALRRYAVLDTPPEQAFDDLTLLAAHTCQVPTAVISLIDENRQWFKSRVGLAVDQTHRDLAFCSHTILDPAQVLEVPDARVDPRFADNPLVLSEPHIRFYAGAPLVTPDGHALGTLCVIDEKPGKLLPEQLAALRALGRAVVAQLELRRQARELEAREVEASRLLRLAEKSRRALLGVLEDEKLATQNLRKSEERFRQLIANGTDIIALIDALGVISYQSPSTSRILGHEPEAMTGRRIDGFIHPDDQGKVTASIQNILAGERIPAPVEFRIRHRDGTWRTLQSFGKVMAGPAGEQLIVVNSRDVTESRRLEEQFRQSQKMEAIGQLSGGVAHDFNNLLTVIKGYIGLLRMKNQITPGMVESIQQIDDAASRAANLTRQLLMFSRQQVMQPENLNLSSVVHNMAKMLRRILNESIELRTELDPQPLPIRADQVMVEQVLLNLVVNARDAMPVSGLLRIATSAAVFDEATAALQPPARPGNFVCLMVRDSGTGIPPEVLPHIFEPFFTTKGVGKGTGLGLATIYGIMEQHAGWISVETAPGQGTTFRAYFPREGVAPVETGPDQTAGAAAGGHEGILLVEDDFTVREITLVALTGLGYRVFTATSGRDALQVWEAHRHEIDLLLTDLVMPDGITGLDLAKRLRETQRDLVIIYMSGYSQEVAEGAFAIKEGVNFLPKPFDPQGLAQIVRHSLDRGGTKPPLIPPQS